MNLETIESRLISVLKGKMGGLQSESSIDPSLPLIALGATSLITVAFLLGIEEEFSISWDDAVPSGTFTSIASIAAYLQTKLEDQPN